MAVEIKIFKEDIGLAHPFEYYLETLHHLPYARIEVRTSDGIMGKGEIACSLDANGESAASAMTLAEPLAATLKGIEILSEEDIGKALAACDLYVAFNRATKCGLEQALFDILAQKEKKTVTELLGAVYRPIKIQCTIPFLENETAYKNRFATVLPAQPEHVKFKLGKNFKLEAEMIHAFHALAPQVSISVDANQAFASATEAVAFLKTLGSVKLCWAEQLLRREDTEGWKELRKHRSVPLMADESIHTSREALWYLENGLVDFINVKLAKSGGVLEARKIIALARTYNVPVMLGSMLHGELGLRYNLTFGLSESFVTYDFYSYFSLKEHGESVLIDPETLVVTEAVLS